MSVNVAYSKILDFTSVKCIQDGKYLFEIRCKWENKVIKSQALLQDTRK